MIIEKKVIGTNRVANKLRRLVVEKPEPGQVITRRWLKKLALTLRRKKYPPKRPNQRYTRTGRLRRRWRADGEKVMNTANYAGWVVGKKTQAWMHVGRWWTFEAVFEEKRPELVKELTEYYRKQWEKS